MGRPPHAIELRNVSKSFGNYPVISQMELTIFAGERIALLGPNGAGKSTLLRIIAGLLPADSGQVYIEGERQTGSGRIRRQIGTKIGYLPDEPPLYDLLNPIEFLEYTAALWKIPFRSVEQRLVDLLDQYRMTPAARMWISHFSKGMRQKLGLISVLFRCPPILLLDEPFTALDSDAIETTVRYLRIREHFQTAIIVSHDLDLVEQVADRAVILHQGRIIAEFSTCSSLKTRYEQVKRRFRLDDDTGSC